MEESELDDHVMVVELTSQVVSAYVSNNPLAAGDLPALINDVHTALGGLSAAPKEPPAEKPKPAVSIKKSLNRDYLIC
ncbi:MAG: MucR family transcriptional regulator, partial [Pseudomonadota bacterium]